MTPTARSALNRMAEAYRKGTALALFFDYDGTLAPIVERPELARLDRKMGRLLVRLARRPRVSAAIVSGRALEDLKSVCNLPHVQYAGSSGMEIECDGVRLVQSDAPRCRGIIRRLVERFRLLVEDCPGAWVEDKGLTLTVHFRSVAAERIEPLSTLIRETIHPLAGQVRAMGGPMAIEIVPEVGWNKGSAVRVLLDQLGISDVLPLYAGDGENDAEALALVSALGGVSIGVGRDAPDAGRCRMSGPEELRELLLALDRSLEPPPGRLRSISAETLALYGQWKPLLTTHGL